MEVLGALLDRVSKDWKKPNNRVVGPILRPPAISLGVGEQRFMENWGIFQIDSVTASRAIRWTSVRFDYPTKAVY